jgi:hypothetical protein
VTQLLLQRRHRNSSPFKSGASDQPSRLGKPSVRARVENWSGKRGPERAAAWGPETYGAVVMLGATLYLLGDDAAALPALERAHELNPADEQTTAVLDQLKAEQQK